MLETLEQFAKIAPAFLVPLTALGALITAGGVLVSLFVGISTLREVRKGRQYSVRPFCLFAAGGQMIPIEFTDRHGIVGIEPNVALQTVLLGQTEWMSRASGGGYTITG